MPLTVLSVAYPLAPVGPDAVGGAEQVLSRLDHALVQAGHRSLVVACEGSAAAGTLLPVPRPAGPLDAAAIAAAQARHRRLIAETLARQPVDVVHMHGIDFHRYLPPPGPALLATLHLPPDWYPAPLAPRRPRSWLHCVSAAQDRACPPDLPRLPPIGNGVPADRRAGRRPARRGFALALGRICPEKGLHHALDAARLCGRSLLLAGRLYPYPAHSAYFAAEIRPRLDRRRRFLGPVGGAHKRRLLAAARCLLVPSLAPETSSLAAMEALACGTPVIAFPAGALAEIVEPGVTGYLVSDAVEMAAAIEAADAIDPEACRAAARERFPLAAMTERYLALYARLAGGGP